MDAGCAWTSPDIWSATLTAAIEIGPDLIVASEGDSLTPIANCGITLSFVLRRTLAACGRQKEAMRLAYNANVICASTSAASAPSEESDTPMRRTPFRIGN